MTVKNKTHQLTSSMRREVMTPAEQLEERGSKEASKEIAIKLLKEGSETALVHKITGLSVAELSS
jgi:hypothetical protein